MIEKYVVRLLIANCAELSGATVKYGYPVGLQEEPQTIMVETKNPGYAIAAITTLVVKATEKLDARDIELFKEVMRAFYNARITDEGIIFPSLAE